MDNFATTEGISPGLGADRKHRDSWLNRLGTPLNTIADDRGVKMSPRQGRP